MRIIFAEGVGIFLFERDGYTRAPGSAGVAGVYGRLLGGSCVEAGNLRMSMLLGGAEKMLPTSSMMITITIESEES